MPIILPDLCRFLFQGNFGHKGLPGIKGIPGTKVSAKLDCRFLERFENRIHLY